MTAPLRRVHLRAWIALTALLAMTFVAALAVRRSAAARNELHWESVR